MRCKAVLAFEMYERKCTIFQVRILENCDTRQRNCCLPVLLHPLERRCVSSLAFGNFALLNKRFSLEEATILLNLAVKSGDISRTVSTTMKFISTISVRGIVELENALEAAS